MNIKPILNNGISDDFIVDYLAEKGVDCKFVYSYVNMNDFIEDEFYNTYIYADYDTTYNISDASTCFIEKIYEKANIGIVVDSDCDGYCSAAMMGIFIKESTNNENTNIRYFFHNGKQHGIKDVVNEIIGSNIELLIVPDAGSNDIEECRVLTGRGIDIIILDHHEVIKDNPYAIVVNPHLEETEYGEEYGRMHISGAAVTHDFIYYVVERFCNDYEYGEDVVNRYKDLVALSTISDVCDMRSLWNRAFVYYGLKEENITNPLLKLMFEKLCTKGVTPKEIAWRVAPPINALCRGDNQEDKQIFFKSLIGELPPEDGLKVARRAHRQQTETIKRMYEDILPSLDNSHKVVIGFAEASDANYIGLAANKVLSAYNKPVILLRDADDEHYSGSLRSPVPLSSLINQSAIAESQGHENAAGVFVNKASLQSLVEYLDEQLDTDVQPEIEVAAIIKPQDINLHVCKLIEDNAMLWGHGLEEPKFYIKLQTEPSDISVFRKASTTVKIQQCGVDFLKFQANDADVDMLTNGPCEIEAIVTLKVNEYNGEYMPQAMIEQWEIAKSDEEKFDWDEIFK